MRMRDRCTDTDRPTKDPVAGPVPPPCPRFGTHLTLCVLLHLLAVGASPIASAAQCDYVVRNDWNSGFTVDFTITNDGSEPIDTWEVGLAYDDGSQITSAWNANLSGSNPYRAGNKGYNGTIAPGASKGFGLNGRKAQPGSPAPAPVLSGICTADGNNNGPSPEPPASGAASCSYRLANAWGSGFTGEVTITNAAERTIDGWFVTVAYPDGSQLSGTWNGKQGDGPPYRIDHANHNRVIAPGASVSFGFNAQRPTHGAPDTTPSLGGICAQTSTNRSPVALATASAISGGAPLSVSFDAGDSTDPDGDALSYSWVFGDGATSDQLMPTHVFETPGIYEVSLSVNDGVSSSTPLTLSITVTGPATEPDPEATYTLERDRSSLFFASTKKSHTVEAHSFTRIAGRIDAAGAALVSIDLDSVDTGIPVRDQRLRDHLFETALHGTARITLDIDLGDLAAMPVGSSRFSSITPTVSLHGVVLPVSADVRVTKLSPSSILVQSTAPVLVNAADFDLEGGVEVLRTLAGLDVISLAVPVSFNLLFTSEGER